MTLMEKMFIAIILLTIIVIVSTVAITVKLIEDNGGVKEVSKEFVRDFKEVTQEK